MRNQFERLPVDEARPRPLVLAGLVLCVVTVIFCVWQTRDKQQAALATPKSARVEKHVTFVTPTIPKTENVNTAVTVHDSGGTFVSQTVGSKPAEFLTQEQLRQKQVEAQKKQKISPPEQK